MRNDGTSQGEITDFPPPLRHPFSSIATMNPSRHTEMPSLNGKRVFITGGTTGIGRAIANLLGSEGAKIFTCGRNAEPLNDALVSIRSSGAFAEGCTADLSRAEGITRVFSAADEALGGLDIFINNAALAGGGVEEETDESWRYIVESNLLGYIGCAKEAIARMKPRKTGHIVLIGSMSADVREAGSSVYVATKSGIQGFAEALRKEVNKDGIKVSLIEPGKTGSDMQDSTPEEQRQMIEKGEMLRAEDVAVATHYVLTQPARCDVVVLQLRPHLQLI
ncbi:MAG TPA: SDR family oxidoreductase [Chthoniobacteraceae bacterium]|nr:SDR family oxidoreductase [Chthoniobacteraceae bacterium]